MERLTRAKSFLSGSLVVVAVLIVVAVLAPHGLISMVRALSGNGSSGTLFAPPRNNAIEVVVETVGVSNLQPVVILKEKDGDRRLPLFIGLLEANAISVVLEHVEVPRPLTADLLYSVVRSSGSGVAYVTIHELRDRTFYATLVLTSDGALVEIDARPSDAIAVALRSGAPVYVADAVMDAAGVKPEEKPGKTT